MIFLLLNMSQLNIGNLEYFYKLTCTQHYRTGVSVHNKKRSVFTKT